ncbi:MAG: acyclic terpene utilization AtuA family protein [Actinomycetota bacterium]|uniref:Exopolyphosphatase n=1 Tax=marine metagenome TaxID=408172 RepID=A0A381PRK3_9ZZZZ|nr:acyclic terpene utilization AtuA family protein [Actinomycetota bacterium]MEE3187551.1 acyclic terpene utilization AtuA family protein [Actinomycetota bacterium]|tara:strand:+ start:10272 stop:12044 length:1773 start_codon:yes stop_codon:yes gene_type:complete
MPPSTGQPIRIANCSGFFGDRLAAAKEMVHGGPIDALTGDWLAELTMLILSRIQAKAPGRGYARTFVTQMEDVMGECLDRGIKVVSNAGGLNPEGCADAVQEVADRFGLQPSIAYVAGDDISGRLQELLAAGNDFTHLDTGEPLGELADRIVTANAYIGCWGIVEALNQGADIVITGRATDAAVVAGPAAWYHGWERDHWDSLAGAIVAGHVIECGGQATGGNYSFFTEIEDLTYPGFPWAEVFEDGSSIIGKHDATGGEVSIGTITSQLLYEIQSERYFNPDVVSRFDTIQLEQVEKDRVRIFGTRGEPAPEELKVAMNYQGGFRNQISIGLTGLDIEEKAELIERQFWNSCPYSPDDYETVVRKFLPTHKTNPATNEEAVAVYKIIVKDPDERKVGRAFSNAGTEIGLCSIPGMFGTAGGPGPGQPFGVYWPTLLDSTLAPMDVIVGGKRTVIDNTPSESAPDIEPLKVALPDLPQGVTRSVPLGTLFGTRSGDKGPNANLGVFARTPEAFVWLSDFLTIDRLKSLMPEAADRRIERFDLPNLWSLNFIFHGLLEEGVAASTRQDPQAKALGEYLRAKVVDIPEVLLL